MPARIFILATAAVLLTGCAATMVAPAGRPSDSPYAPLNEASRSGIVKYLNEGAAFVRKARRESAYKQMHESCGGAYVIEAEGPRAEGGAVVTLGSADGTSYEETSYLIESSSWYIQYRCAA